MKFYTAELVSGEGKLAFAGLTCHDD